jgi:prephenate dehydrogenase
MKLHIVGEGSFGIFLNGLLFDHFDIDEDADSVILAVPLYAYDDVARKYQDKHLINVCSVQEPSTKICLKYSDRVTSIHPLFGKRTPVDNRNTILTRSYLACNDTWLSEDTIEQSFINIFGEVSNIITHDHCGKLFTPESHDILMAKTHVAAVRAAKQLQIYIDAAKDIPDEMVPNSFRLMREFVKTLDDMPYGTVTSIMANPYI